jgi:hypothetical protein
MCEAIAHRDVSCRIASSNLILSRDASRTRQASSWSHGGSAELALGCPSGTGRTSAPRVRRDAHVLDPLAHAVRRIGNGSVQ